MTHRRSPYKLRADGQIKDLQLHRRIVAAFGAAAAEDPDDGVGWPPSERSAERTRSKAWRAGTRRTKRHAKTGAGR
jgi:hypothetical protein